MNDIERLERRYHNLALVFQTLTSLNNQLWAAIREYRKFSVEESCGQGDHRKWIIEISPREQA